MTLPVPSSGTVLSMSGLNFNLYNNMPQSLQGVLSTAPYVMQKVNYPASTSRKSITTGVANFNSAVRASALSGVQKIGFGHSQGAQVMSRWMREYAADPTAPGPDELMFILTGNPLRSTGGYIIGRPEVDGVTGLPTPLDTPWTIVDVARRYDGWADWVTDETNATAVQNANSGRNSYHTNYAVVDLFDPAHTVWTVDNTTYVLTQESPPYFKKLIGSIPTSLASSLKAKIELAYTNRPVDDPPVEVIPTLGWWTLVRKYFGA